MHAPQHDNHNKPIIDVGDSDVPLTFFNTVRLNRDEEFVSSVPGYETCLVPAHGTIDAVVEEKGVANATFEGVGDRASVWEGEPSAVYVPVRCTARLVCRSASTEVFVAGARFDEMFKPFVVRPTNIDPVQYGSV